MVKKNSKLTVTAVQNLLHGEGRSTDAIATITKLCNEWLEDRVARWSGSELKSLGGVLLAGIRSDFHEWRVYIPEPCGGAFEHFNFFTTEKKALAYAEKYAKRQGFEIENSQISRK